MLQACVFFVIVCAFFLEKKHHIFRFLFQTKMCSIGFQFVL